MLGSILTRGAKAGNTIQAGRLIGTAANAQIPSIVYREYYAMDSEFEFARVMSFISFPNDPGGPRNFYIQRVHLTVVGDGAGTRELHPRPAQ